MSENANNKNTSIKTTALITVIALITATIPNIGQLLYEQGISFKVIDALKLCSYFIFAITVMLVWAKFPESKIRWALLALIPLVYIQAFQSGFTQITWLIGGFAP